MAWSISKVCYLGVTLQPPTSIFSPYGQGFLTRGRGGGLIGPCRQGLSKGKGMIRVKTVYSSDGQSNADVIVINCQVSWCAISCCDVQLVAVLRQVSYQQLRLGMYCNQLVPIKGENRNVESAFGMNTKLFLISSPYFSSLLISLFFLISGNFVLLFLILLRTF